MYHAGHKDGAAQRRLIINLIQARAGFHEEYHLFTLDARIFSFNTVGVPEHAH